MDDPYSESKLPPSAAKQLNFSYHSDFEDKHKLDMSAANPMRSDRKLAKQLLTTV